MKKNSDKIKAEKIKQDFLVWFGSLSEDDKRRFQKAFGRVDLSPVKPLDNLLGKC